MKPHTRIDYQTFVEIAPAAKLALLALGKAVDDSGLEKSLTELVKLRASQMNGCAFCLGYHLDIARKVGVPREKLDLLAVWREAGVFSQKECAALAWAEDLVEVGRTGARDAAYADLLLHFTQAEVVALTVAIGVINAWNRIGVALRFAPPLQSATEKTA